MNPLLLGIIVGFVLALLHFFAFSFISSKVIRRSKMTSVTIALGGFIAKLTMLALVFYGLTKIKEIHFQTALLSFIICFTLFLIFITVRFYRKLGSIQRELLGR